MLDNTISRREFLKRAGIAGAALGAAGGLGGLLAACGSGETTTTTAAAATTTTAAAARPPRPRLRRDHDERQRGRRGRPRHQDRLRQPHHRQARQLRRPPTSTSWIAGTNTPRTGSSAATRRTTPSRSPAGQPVRPEPGQPGGRRPHQQRQRRHDDGGSTPTPRCRWRIRRGVRRPLHLQRHPVAGLVQRPQGGDAKGAQVDLPLLLGPGRHPGALLRDVGPVRQQQGVRRPVAERRRRQRVPQVLASDAGPRTATRSPTRGRSRTVSRTTPRSSPPSRRTAPRSAPACSQRPRLHQLLDAVQAAGLRSEGRDRRQGPAVLADGRRLWATSAYGLTTVIYWTPTFPFKSSLTGETCQQFADEYDEAQRRTVEPASVPLRSVRDGDRLPQADQERGRQGRHRRPGCPR